MAAGRAAAERVVGVAPPRRRKEAEGPSGGWRAGEPRHAFPAPRAILPFSFPASTFAERRHPPALACYFLAVSFVIKPHRPMTASRFRPPCLRTCLALLPLALVAFGLAARWVLPAVHRSLGICPLTLSRFDELEAIPVLYGLPTPAALDEAAQGRIMLGGCLIGQTVAVCPHCHLGVKFHDWTADWPAP